VTPEEIERVDVMYGPFSAAYPGNSAGAVVDYVTRMPTSFEAHAKVGVVAQPFELYGMKSTYRARQASVSVGSRDGDWSWWIHLNRTDSDGQPLTFATRLVSSGVAGGNGTPVTGAVAGLNNANQAWWLIGAGTQYHTVQDHLKVKLAYDLGPMLRASYVFGAWRNEADGNSQSWLRDAAGQPVYGGAFNIDDKAYAAPTGGDFAITREKLHHTLHGLSLKRRTGAGWDWELAASLYDYGRDDKRQNAAANPQPGALTGGAGTLADGSGTGWHTLAAKGIWRPAGSAHVVDFGLQQDSYQLRYATTTLADYLHDSTGTPAGFVGGKARLQGAYAQDAWLITPVWKAVLGLRAERWATDSAGYAPRRENDLSPKAALSWQATPETVLKTSIARAVRMPTVNELYGAITNASSQFISNNSLKPEKSWTAEFSAEQGWGPLQSRVTLFAEITRDSIYSQTTFDAGANRNISTVQNIDRMATTGLEATLATTDWLATGLDLSASATYTDSRIKANGGFVAAPGDTLGKWQPNIARWRATAQAAWRFNNAWNAHLAVRYSGPQYRTLNNADVNGFAYQGVSSFLTADLRVRWKMAPQWTAAVGIDNLNNDKYWNFHPYPQRSYSAELKFDLRGSPP